MFIMLRDFALTLALFFSYMYDKCKNKPAELLQRQQMRTLARITDILLTLTANNVSRAHVNKCHSLKRVENFSLCFC